MPIILLRLTKAEYQPNERPSACPYCGSQILQRWGQVSKPVKDPQDLRMVVYRYRCEECERTFRDYPKGVDRSDYSCGIRKLAALIWALGLSYRDIISIFEDIGIQLSRSTVWSEGQELVTRLNGRKLHNHIQRFRIDKNHIHTVSSKSGVVVAVDFGLGKYTILGTLDEHNPLSVKSWLQPLIQDTNIRVLELGTGKLDLFRTSNHIDTVIPVEIE
jgi:DNA-directed RNA polymerase subunit RPC12/RpoP